VSGLLRSGAGLQQQEDPVGLHGATHAGDVVALLELLDLGQQLRQPEVGRPVHHQPHGALVAVLDEQHRGLREARVREALAGHEEDAGRQDAPATRRAFGPRVETRAATAFQRRGNGHRGQCSPEQHEQRAGLPPAASRRPRIRRRVLQWLRTPGSKGAAADAVG
jgi:hypothetical protein